MASPRGCAIGLKIIFDMQQISLRSAIAAFLCLLGGCTVGPDFVAPKSHLPAQFSEAPATAAQVAATNAQLQQWWRSFDDRELNQLITLAIADNIDLKIADQRLLQARAQRDEIAAGAYPTLGATAEAERARASTTLEYPPGFGNYHDFIGGFDASWELDIFGGNRRATEAAQDRVFATIEGRRALMVSLLSEVASDYATLRATQTLLAIAQDNVRVANDVYQLTERELKSGIGTDLQTLQARAQLEATEAKLPGLKAQIAVMAHAIAILLGRTPDALLATLSRPVPLMSPPADMPATVPAAVIANRPDVHEAEFAYEAANAQIGVAIAARLPDFSIPLSIMPEASAINQLFSFASLAYAATLSASAPLYQGGKLNAREREARAAAQAARLHYHQVVLQALAEVQNDLVHLQSDQQTHLALSAAYRDSQTALDHATLLYHAGLTDFLTLLTNERANFAAHDALAQNDLALVQDYIALFKALGGTPEAAPPAAVKP